MGVQSPECRSDDEKLPKDRPALRGDPFFAEAGDRGNLFRHNIAC